MLMTVSTGFGKGLVLSRAKISLELQILFFKFDTFLLNGKSSDAMYHVLAQVE
jgi:hypothetical protein